MKIIGKLIFVLSLLFFLIAGLSAFEVFPKEVGNVFLPFGVSGTLLTAAVIPVNGLDTSGVLELGKIIEHHPAERVITKACDGAIKFGRAVVLGASGGLGKLVSGATDVFIGVAKYSYEASDLDNLAYADKDVLAVQEIGVIAVYVEEAVTPSSVVRVRHTNHASDPLKLAGNFCDTADAGKTFVLKGAKFVGTTTGAGTVGLLLTGNFETSADV